MKKAILVPIFMIFLLLVSFGFLHFVFADEVNNLVEQGTQFLNKKRFDDAITIFDRAIILDSQRYEAYLGLGLAYGEGKGKWNRALEYFKKSVQLAPNIPDCHLGLGMAYAQTGDKQSALKEAEILEKLNKTDAANMLRIYAVAVRQDVPVEMNLDEATKSGKELMKIIEDLDKAGKLKDNN